MKKGLANHPMTMTFTTHRDLPVCRNLSIGFLAKLPPCHSKGKIWWMLQSGSMKKLLAAITGLKSGLGCGKNSKIFEDYVVQYMFRYFMKLNLSQLIQKKFKVWFFKHAMKNLLYKQKKVSYIDHTSWEDPLRYQHICLCTEAILCVPLQTQSIEDLTRRSPSARWICLPPIFRQPKRQALSNPGAPLNRKTWHGWKIHEYFHDPQWQALNSKENHLWHACTE